MINTDSSLTQRDYIAAKSHTNLLLRYDCSNYQKLSSHRVFLTVLDRFNSPDKMKNSVRACDSQLC